MNVEINKLMMAFLTTPEILTQKQIDLCNEIKNMIASELWERFQDGSK